MKRRLPDLVLLVLFLVGGSWAWTTGQERRRLQADFDRLVRSTGDLPIGDPSKVHVRAISTSEPLHFAWRVYLPPNYRLIWRTSSGGSGSSSSAKPEEFIARVRLREEGGVLHIYDHYYNGSSRSNLGDESMARLIRGRWEKLKVEQLGSQDVATIEADGTATLVRLTIPDDWQDEARKTLSPYLREPFNPALFTVEIGPEKPHPPSTVPGN